MTFKLNNPLLNNREVTVHKMVQYYSGNNIVAHMHVHKHKVIIHYIIRLYRTTLCCGVMSELPRNSGVSFSLFSRTKV